MASRCMDANALPLSYLGTGQYVPLFTDVNQKVQMRRSWRCPVSKGDSSLGADRLARQAPVLPTVVNSDPHILSAPRADDLMSVADRLLGAQVVDRRSDMSGNPRCSLHELPAGFEGFAHWLDEHSGDKAGPHKDAGDRQIR